VAFRFHRARFYDGGGDGSPRALSLP